MTNKHSEFLADIYGEYCWNFRKGFGTFLLLDFGQPYLVIREPIRVNRAGSDRRPNSLANRHVTALGEWQLWVQCSGWRLTCAEGSVSWDGPSGDLDSAMKSISGQKLVGVTLDRAIESTVMTFDLGGEIIVPFKADQDDGEECWDISRKDGARLSCDDRGVLSAG